MDHEERTIFSFLYLPPNTLTKITLNSLKEGSTLTGLVENYRKNVRAVLRSSILFTEKTTILLRLTHQLELLCASFQTGLSSSFAFYQEEKEGIRNLYEEMRKMLTYMGVTFL